MPQAIADRLLRFVEQAASRLSQLDPQVARLKPAADRWSIQEVIGHLVDSAANNHQRFVRAQLVDELSFPKYDQNEWVSVERFNDSEWLELLEFWRLYNRHLAQVVRRVRPASLDVVCRIGSYEPMTLRALIDDYVVHLAHHLQKIADRLGDASILAAEA